MEEINIRKMEQGDYLGVRVVDELTQRQYLGPLWEQLSAAEKKNHLQSKDSDFELHLHTGYCFVGITDKIVVGFVLAHEMLPFRDTISIQHIAIHPDYQGRRIGALLYKALIEKAGQSKIKKVSALINLDNQKSMKLHEKLGFELRDRKEAILLLK